jgi:hypothetical protein
VKDFTAQLYQPCSTLQQQFYRKRIEMFNKANTTACHLLSKQHTSAKVLEMSSHPILSLPGAQSFASFPRMHLLFLLTPGRHDQLVPASPIQRYQMAVYVVMEHPELPTYFASGPNLFLGTLMLIMCE